MIDYLWMWSELIVRWVHVIAGIAWIGSSFYFIALDLSLNREKNYRTKRMARHGKYMAAAFTTW